VHLRSSLCSLISAVFSMVSIRDHGSCPTCSLKGFTATLCKMCNLIFASFRCDPLHIPPVLVFLIPLEQISTQEYIITQWTSVQAELATFTFPQIGSISHFSKDTGAIIGKLSTAVAEGLSDEGPFKEAWDYFAAVADAKFRQACKNDVANDRNNILTRPGPFVFKFSSSWLEVIRSLLPEISFLFRIRETTV
jgi:hypothetical protein